MKVGPFVWGLVLFSRTIPQTTAAFRWAGEEKVAGAHLAKQCLLATSLQGCSARPTPLARKLYARLQLNEIQVVDSISDHKIKPEEGSQLGKFGKRCSRETTQLHLCRAYNESTISTCCSGTYSPSTMISFLLYLNNKPKYVFRQGIKPAMTSVVKYITVHEDLKTHCLYPWLFHKALKQHSPMYQKWAAPATTSLHLWAGSPSTSPWTLRHKPQAHPFWPHGCGRSSKAGRGSPSAN